MESNLFGSFSPEPPTTMAVPPMKKKKKEKLSHPLWPWFEAISAVVGPITVRQSGGRVAKIAKAMQVAGLPSSRVKEIVDVVHRHWPSKKFIDLATLQNYWPYILEDPMAVKPDVPNSLDLLAEVMDANGGKLIR